MTQEATEIPTLEAVLADPSSSSWLLQAARSARDHDPVKVAHMAMFLAQVLEARADHILAQALMELRQEDDREPQTC